MIGAVAGDPGEIVTAGESTRTKNTLSQSLQQIVPTACLGVSISTQYSKGHITAFCISICISTLPTQHTTFRLLSIG